MDKEIMKVLAATQEQVRRQKMQDLIDMGIDPFGSRYDHYFKFGYYQIILWRQDKEELDELQVTVKIAGRIMTKRRQGKAGFMNIQDRERSNSDLCS